MTAGTDPAAPSADSQALAHLRSADPVLARVIDAHADFDAHGWLRELPAMDSISVSTCSRCTSSPSWVHGPSPACRV